MKITKSVRCVSILTLTLLLVFVMSGCKGNQAEENWEKETTSVMNSITTDQTEFNTALAAIQPGDTASQTAMLNAIDKLEGDFKKLKEIQAPEKYQSVQGEFNTAVDKALEGTAAFREMANNLGDGGDLTIISNKLSEGQTTYADFLTLWQTAVDHLSEVVDGGSSK